MAAMCVKPIGNVKKQPVVLCINQKPEADIIINLNAKNVAGRSGPLRRNRVKASGGAST